MLSFLCIVSIEVLEMLECGARIQTLGAGERAEADLVAFSQFHVSSEHL